MKTKFQTLKVKKKKRKNLKDYQRNMETKIRYVLKLVVVKQEYDEENWWQDKEEVFFIDDIII